MVRWFAASFALVACSASRAPIVLPSDGATEIVFEDHLPDGLTVANVGLTIDDEPVPARSAGRIFHDRLSAGDHTVKLVVEVRVPCGLASAPYEKLTAKIGRAFEVGPHGGVVHVDAFAQSPWLHPSERVHLLVSLRGLREGRWVYGRSKEAREACGRLAPLERSRCVVERLAERSRAKGDIAGLLCQKNRLDAIEDVIFALDERDAKHEVTKAGAVPPESRVFALEREAELCVAEDLGWLEQPEVTSDRSACAAYDMP